MSDKDQERFARSCSDAAVGYATAGAAFCQALTMKGLEMWSEALRGMAPPAPEPRSWYRHPDAPAARATSPWASSTTAALTPWSPAPASLWPATPSSASPMASLPGTFFWPGVPMMMNPWTTPWNTWLGLMGTPRPQTTLPMAFVMIAAGVPQSVAVPTAEANSAMLDAAEIANRTLQRAMANARASAPAPGTQVVRPAPASSPDQPPLQMMVVSATLPLASLLLLPWLAAGLAMSPPPTDRSR